MNRGGSSPLRTGVTPGVPLSKDFHHQHGYNIPPIRCSTARTCLMYILIHLPYFLRPHANVLLLGIFFLFIFAACLQEAAACPPKGSNL